MHFEIYFEKCGFHNYLYDNFKNHIFGHVSFRTLLLFLFLYDEKLNYITNRKNIKNIKILF